MALSNEEKQILEYAKENGKTAVEARAAIAKYRTATSQVQEESASTTKKQRSPFDVISGAAKKVTDFIGLKPATDVLGTVAAREGFGPQTREEGLNVPPVSNREVVGATLQTTAAAASPAIGGTGPLAAKIASGVAGGYAYDIGQDLAEGKTDVEAATPGFAAAAGFLGPLGGPAAKAGGAAAKAATKAVTNSPLVKGALEGGIELAERVPRFVNRRAADLRDSAARAERIAKSPEPIAKALRTGMDERIINTIEQADEPTRSKYAEIVRLAEETNEKKGTLKSTARPEIVAGEAAADQYKLIDQQQRKVGKAIGDAVASLSKETQVPMGSAHEKLDEALREIGIGVRSANEKLIDTIDGGGGKALDFGKTGFTKAQRAKITELYELATEGGETLTPAQVHAKDRLFSQLQRETRMDGIGDIIVPVGEANTSLFRIFRDVYSETLEEVAPEIKPLNKQYRNLSTFTEDIENSIIKGGKFETNSRIDPAEFAQTNLRRLFSEAASAADYRAIADEMDAAARALGYQGAVPADLAQFAYEIRKIYPEATPRTGFEGSIKASLSDIAGKVLNAGRPDIVDQQKALRELLDSYLPQ